VINVGVVGIGFMGMIHYLSYQQVRGAKVRAIADTVPKRLAGDWRDIKGNFGPPGQMMDLQGVTPYERWQDLIRDPKIDLVDVCLPPALHAEVTIAALKAGKHVLCEKPITLAPSDAAKMVAAAERSGKLLSIGQVLPFFPAYQFAYRAIRGGKYGRLLGGHFKRIISEPLWIRDFWDPNRVGGPVIDLHIHDVHFIRLVCGMPRSVFSSGRMRGDVVEFLTTQFRFEDPRLAVTAISGVIAQQGREFTHGFEIHLEKATLLFDAATLGGKFTVTMPLTVLTADGKVQTPKLDETDAFVAEMREAVGAVKAGKASPLLDGNLARDALVICHKETQSVRTGKLVAV
jgi:predicted dehydrogenase